jgi:uncharacterized Zn finger protein (UPF0148 family)
MLDEKGRPTDSRWLNSFARLVVLTVPESALGGLTKAKIQERATGFQVAVPVVTFAIERHPAAFVEAQTWRYDVKAAELKLIEERVVSTDLAVGPDGSYVCPECGERDLEITPGTVSCPQCGYLVLHEHTEGPVPLACIVNDLMKIEEEEEEEEEEGATGTAGIPTDSTTPATRAPESSRAGSTRKLRSNMYQRAKTWNPFKGCGFACTYCVESFQRQAKRQKHKCSLCYQYKPHFHPERLDEIRSAPIIFVCGNGDIAFASPEERSAIIAGIRKWTDRHPRSETVFYMQSKQPSCLESHLADLPDNVILVTTLETNRDAGYEAVSKAPPPSERYRQFLALNYPRKIVTVEPVMDFDPEILAEWITTIKPELVYLGFNSRMKPKLPEPSLEKLVKFTSLVSSRGIPIVGKTLRGFVLPGVP